MTQPAGPKEAAPGAGPEADLAAFVAEAYGRAYRTACFLLRNPADAEEAVQEAFLRAWRFRAAVRDGEATEQWPSTPACAP